ncbi:hypothetical protein LTR85_006295 [Meristemomyces frigidus]|nr:hypothetical protein LTR85_006295 [Meristemomyces frigidus]
MPDSLYITMWSSPLFSGTGAACILFFLSSATAQYIPGASLFTGNGAPGAGAYQLVDNYQPSGFFNKFTFYSSYDPTYGHVQYVNESIAVQNGYATTGATANISVDTTNQWPNGGPGRPAVRIISDNTYTHGLFILDIVHMPWGCGTWPAYWLLGNGPLDWPAYGEVDMIEGVNTANANTVSLHTSANCTITGSGQTATFEQSDCVSPDNGNSGCGSTFNNTLVPNNYGDGLNSIGGGVYATEWTSNYIKTWFFPRGSIPASITNGAPDVTTFGTPAVNAQGNCNIDSHFVNMSIIINTDFCGAYAGEVYEYSYPNCPANITDTRGSGDTSLNSCVDFVGMNPAYFVDAYWEINSIKVYQMPPGAQPSSSYTTSLSSVTPAASTGATSSMGVGMGVSSTTLSSAPYTGPLTSVTTSTSALSPSGTPAICPSYNNTAWTDANNQQYTIACGSDLGGAATVSNTLSFEACMEACDRTNGCAGVSYVGGNGAGTCYVKTQSGMSLTYSGSANAAHALEQEQQQQQCDLFFDAVIVGHVQSRDFLKQQLVQHFGIFNCLIFVIKRCCLQYFLTGHLIKQPSEQLDFILQLGSRQFISSDTSGATGAYASTQYSSGDWTQCAAYCDANAGCHVWVWAAYTTGGGVCYLKHTPQSPAFGASGLVAGFKQLFIFELCNHVEQRCILDIHDGQQHVIFNVKLGLTDGDCTLSSGQQHPTDGQQWQELYNLLRF